MNCPKCGTILDAKNRYGRLLELKSHMPHYDSRCAKALAAKEKR